MLNPSKPTESEFSAVMANRSDVELVEIVTTARDDYQPEAVEAAEIEIKKRSLNTEKIKAAEKIIEEKDLETKERENEPLDTHWRILCILFPGLINFFLAFLFKGQGRDRKFKETWRWTIYGFLMYFGLIILIRNL